MSNSIAANDIIQNIDDLLAEYPVDECISILQEVVKQIDCLLYTSPSPRDCS